MDRGRALISRRPRLRWSAPAAASRLSRTRSASAPRATSRPGEPRRRQPRRARDFRRRVSVGGRSASCSVGQRAGGEGRSAASATAPPASASGLRVGGLVVVHRVADRAPGSPAGRRAASSATVEAPERQITRWRRPAVPACRGRRCDSSARRRPRRRRRSTRFDVLGRGICCAIRSSRLRSSSGRSASASGTISVKMRAPWLPPITSRWTSPPSSRAG